MLDLHIEREEPEESKAEKRAREARQEAEVIADMQRRFPGAWGPDARLATREDVIRSGITSGRGLTLDMT